MNEEITQKTLDLTALARYCRVLANDGRLKIISILLEHGEISVSDMNRLMNLSQSALSQHLAIFRREDMVSTRRASQTIYYSLKGGVLDEIQHQLSQLQQTRTTSEARVITQDHDIKKGSTEE